MTTAHDEYVNDLDYTDLYPEFPAAMDLLEAWRMSPDDYDEAYRLVKGMPAFTSRKHREATLAQLRALIGRRFRRRERATIVAFWSAIDGKRAREQEDRCCEKPRPPSR